MIIYTNRKKDDSKNKSHGTIIMKIGGGGQPEPQHDYSQDYFFFKDVSGEENSVSVHKNSSSAPDVTIYYSYDQEEWAELGTTSSTALSVALPANGKVYFKANATAWGNNSGYNNYFSTTKNANVCGNALSLLHGDNYKEDKTLSAHALRRLLYNNTKLISAENLVLEATDLFYYCYFAMFQNCTALTTAPSILPATTLANSCYSGMFQNCTALTTAPELPATRLILYCYKSMFSGCTALTTAPELPATTLADYCYSEMFRGCTSLTTAPALPANPFCFYCYASMFNGCTNLNSVDVSAVGWNTTFTTNWLNGVAATGTFTKPAGTEIPTGISGIPEGWEVINK